MQSESRTASMMQCQQFQILAEDHNSAPEDLFFDQVITALLEIILDEEFEALQSSFMRKHCWMFTAEDENKMEYMTVYQQYQQQIEKHIENGLQAKVLGFQMKAFLGMLDQRANQIDEQVLEMFQSFYDFQVFKQLILDYKSSYQQQQKLKQLQLQTTHHSEHPTDPQISYPSTMSQNQLLLPQLILTVTPYRKAHDSLIN